jgi:hypothetical protein
MQLIAVATANWADEHAQRQGAVPGHADFLQTQPDFSRAVYLELAGGRADLDRGYGSGNE